MGSALASRGSAADFESSQISEINRELVPLKRMFTLAVQGGKLYSKPHTAMLDEDNGRKDSSNASSSKACAITCPPPSRRSSPSHI
jgi:hypothetical protein